MVGAAYAQFVSPSPPMHVARHAQLCRGHAPLTMASRPVQGRSPRERERGAGRGSRRSVLSHAMICAAMFVGMPGSGPLPHTPPSAAAAEAGAAEGAAAAAAASVAAEGQSGDHLHDIKTVAFPPQLQHLCACDAAHAQSFCRICIGHRCVAREAGCPVPSRHSQSPVADHAA